MNFCVDCINIQQAPGLTGLASVTDARCGANVSEHFDPVTGIRKHTILPLCASVRAQYPDCPWFNASGSAALRDIVAGDLPKEITP